MLELLIIPDLRQAVLERDWQSLAEFCALLHPSVIAQVLEETEDSELRWNAFAQIEPAARTVIFEYLEDDVQDELVGRLPQAELAGMLERMAHDERVDLVKRMDDERQTVIMPLVARAEREDIRRLMSYEEGTAGAIMTTDYAALPDHLSAGEALARLRREAPDRETIYYVYVIDADRKLVGFVELKDLILAPPARKVADIMRKEILKVSVDMDVEAAAAALAQYDVLALPVVDTEDRLVGIITHDDIIDVVIEEATEDAHLMGAVQPLETDYLSSPFWEMVRKRVVWLGLLFFAEMFSVVVLEHNEKLLATFTVLVLFMPVITATGGNSGSQAATLITRGLALGEVEPADWWRIGLRELCFGVTLGAMVGALGIAAILLFQRPAVYALVLVVALVVVTTCGSMVGSLMPLVFKRIGWDPAISSSPFVASVVDVLGIMIYCTIAAALLVSEP